MTSQPFASLRGAPAFPGGGAPVGGAAPTAPARSLEELLGAARPPARVDLLPREVVRARALRRTQRLLACGFTALVALGGAGYWLGERSVAEAEAELAGAQARTAVLSSEAAEFAEVPAVLSQLDAARAARSTAMASDVRWYEYLDGLTRSLPEDVWLTEVAVTTNAASPAAAQAPADPAAAAAAATVATATFGGVAYGHSDVAQWLDSLDATRGFAAATFSTSVRTALGEEPVVEFDSSVSVTTDALSHRFDGAADTAPAPATAPDTAPAATLDTEVN